MDNVHTDFIFRQSAYVQHVESCQSYINIIIISREHLVPTIIIIPFKAITSTSHFLLMSKNTIRIEISGMYNWNYTYMML